MKTTDNPPGAPSTFTPEIAAEICKQLMLGKSLREICQAEGMPDRGTVHDWAHDDREGFGSQYMRARAIGIDQIADEAIQIANTPVEGVMETDKLGKDGYYTEVRRADMIEHRKLQVDTRKWYVSKLAPKLYGDRTHIEHSGEIKTREFDDEDRAAKIEAIFAAVMRRIEQQRDDGSDLV